MPKAPQMSPGRREPTPGEADLMAAIGVSSVESLDRHLDGLLGIEGRREGPARRAAGKPEQIEAKAGDHPWWLIGAGFGVGVAISGLLLALSRRTNA